MTSDARVCARATPSLTRTRAAYLLLVVKSTFTRRNFELCCAQARRGVAYTPHLVFCSRWHSAILQRFLSGEREPCGGFIVEIPVTIAAEERRSNFMTDRSVFLSPQTPYQGVLDRDHGLIGLVRHNACPYGSAPRIGARPQPRVR